MGMSLSEILNRLNQIENISTKPLDDVLDLIHSVRDIYIDVKFINKSELSATAKELTQSVLAYREEIDSLKDRLKQNIYQDHAQFIVESEKFYHQNINKMTFNEHLEWASKWITSDDDFSNLSSWISNYCHWQQPTLIFGAGSSDIINSVTAADPLYVLERYQEYFYLQKEKFSSNHARKMRFYTLDEVGMLPSNSFSAIVIYNQFNFLPWKQISEMITMFEKCLAPGGRIIFNYNNCRTVKGFQFFEKRLASFSIPSMYADLSREVGLEIAHSYDSINGQFSFIEMAKPGKLNLIKKFPSIGMVKRQSNFGNKVSQDLRTKRLTHIFKS